jgi:hypothetical protein
LVEAGVDSIAHNTFWLLTPSTDISRRVVKAKPWRGELRSPGQAEEGLAK